jgi:O-antigen/teichoic acid export membrane protein
MEDCRLVVNSISEEKPLKAQTADVRHILTAAKGGGIVFAGRLFTYAGRFATSILLARFLAAEQFGMYNLSLSAAELAAGLASFGLGTALVRYIPIYVARRDEEGLWGALQVCLGITTALSLLFAIGLYALAEPIATQLFHSPRLAVLLRLISFLVPFLTVNDTIAAATRGFKNMHYTVISQNFTHPSIKFVFTVALAIVGLNAVRALAVHSLAEIVTFVMLLYFLDRQFPLRRSLWTARREITEIVIFSFPVYLSNLIKTFGGRIQTIMLGAYSTVSNIGIYALARQVNLVSEMFHDSLVAVSQPIISELSSKGESKEFGCFYQTMTKWTFTLNLPMFLIVLLFPGPILSLFGKSFAGGVAILTILACGSLIDTATGICGVILDMTGNTHWKLVNSVGRFVLSLGLNFLLIPGWGLRGAAIASLVTAIIINLLRLIEVFSLFRLLPYNLSFIKPVTAGLGAMAASLALTRILPPGVSLNYAAINILLLLLVYATFILLLGLSPEDRVIIRRLRGRLGTLLSRS